MREVAEGNQGQRMIKNKGKKEAANLEKDAASLGQPICNVGSNPTREFGNKGGRWNQELRLRSRSARSRDEEMLVRSITR